MADQERPAKGDLQVHRVKTEHQEKRVRLVKLVHQEDKVFQELEDLPGYLVALVRQEQKEIR